MACVTLHIIKREWNHRSRKSALASVARDSRSCELDGASLKQSRWRGGSWAPEAQEPAAGGFRELGSSSGRGHQHLPAEVRGCGQGIGRL